MNDLLSSVPNDPLTVVMQAVPEKFHGWAVFGFVTLPFLTRTYHALVNGAGLRGAWNAIWFGTNTPKDVVPASTSNVIKLMAFFILSLAIVPLWFGTGCQSPPQRVAFNVASAPVTTSDQAMKVWGDYVHQFHPAVEQERKVLVAYRKVKAAELAAIDAAHAAANAMSSTNTLSATLTTQLQSPEVSQALSELLDVLRSIGVKI
jgi:hypothetical protein